MGDRVRLYQRLPVTADVAWWRRQVETAPETTVLYLGCGTGRLAAPLAEAARRLVGVDIDPAMLRAFAGRLTGSSLQDRVQLIEADVARLDLGDVTFGVVVLPSSLLNGILDAADREAALRAAAAHCAPDGTVVLQVLNPFWMASEAPSSTGRIEPAAGGASIDVAIRQHAFDAWEQRQQARIVYRFADAQEVVDTVDAVALYPAELRRLAQAAGLEIIERWGARPGVDPVSVTGSSWHLVCRPRAGAAAGD